jgi:hypothetical protein
VEKKDLEKAAELAAVKAVTKSEKRFEDYIGALKEDFDHKIEAIFEYVKDVPAIKKNIEESKAELNQIKDKQDIMFDKIGELAEDVNLIKEANKDYEVRLQRLMSR